jgi:molybdenum cofactor cytidylyltransferase
MIFGPIPLAEAAGAILAHTTRLPGGAIKKGTTLTAADVKRLYEAGYERVIAAKLDACDIGEDEAASRIAAAVSGPNLRVAEAFTGRVNIYAKQDGVARIDRDRIIVLNRIDEAITVATLSPFERVRAGQMIATVKIIPFGVPEAAVEKAEQWLAGNCKPLLELAPFKPSKAYLIITELPGTKPNVLEKRRIAITNRVTSTGSTVTKTEIAAHDPDAIAEAVHNASASGADPILVFGASAIVDRDDVIPMGIRQAGGEVRRVGMPVDPGNLLLLGGIDGRTVIGIPSCASSPKINGFDWVLERTLAGIDVTSDEITEMAVGGLLMEIQSRPQPREKSALGADLRQTPRIAALVLAAGRSTRMGERNKLLEQVAGKSLLRHAVDAARASTASSLTVVTGHEADRIEAELAGTGAILTHNPDYAEGLSTSLIAGLNALPDDIDGAIVLLGDMPGISAKTIDRLIAAFAPDDGRGICVPSFNGRRGNPVLWARRYFSEMKNLAGDIGAKALLGLHSEDVADIPVESDDVLTDIDTPEALELERRAKQ